MINLTDNGYRALTTKYCLRNEQGKPYETPEMIFDRLADGLCGGDLRFREQLHAAMIEHRFYPNTSCFFNLGNRINQLAVCLVLPIEDDLNDILDKARIMGLAQRAGFGVGVNLSNLRPEEAIISSNKSRSCGPLGFLKVYDAIGEIVKHGHWRGAYSAALRDSHPDIFKWIAAKEEEFAYPNFNTAILLSDEFMTAAIDGGTFNLRFGAETKTIDADDLLERVAFFIWLNGGLGVLFSDTMNRANSCPHLYTVDMTNPCGEQPLGPWESCCLGYYNVSAYTMKDGIDWDVFEETIWTGTRCLDNVITANKFLPSVPQIGQAALRTRRIGGGPTGLVDTFIKLGLPYGSPESVQLAAEIMEGILFFTMLESIQLARERGPFPAIMGSVFDPYNMKWQPPEETSGLFDWEEVRWGIKNYGIRNAAFTSVAPSQLSVVMGLEGYGCEPPFSLAYRRHSEGEEDYIFESAAFRQALEAAELEPRVIDEILTQVWETGSCQGIDSVPKKLQRLFRISDEIPPEDHLKIQGALQNSASGGISKTINADKATTVEEVKRLIIKAWKELRIKGFAFYRKDSRERAVCVDGICEV